MSNGQIDVRVRAVKSREQEFKTHHCQPQRANFGDKFQTEQWRIKDKSQANCCPTESQNQCYKVDFVFVCANICMVFVLVMLPEVTVLGCYLKLHKIIFYLY